MSGEPPHGFDLRVSEELNRRIVEAMPGGIVHVLVDGTIRTANAEALRILGLAYDDLTQRYTVDFEPQTIYEDGTPCACADYPVTRALTTGEPQPPVTIGVRRPDGATSWAIFTAVPVRDPDTGTLTGAIVTFLDITTRKQLEAELVMRNRLAAIGTLAAGVAHEVNNPLTYVLVNLEALERDLRDAAPRARQRLTAATEGVERIARIVRDLGVFTQQREGGVDAVDVHEAIESTLRIAATALRDRASVVRRYQDCPPVAAGLARLGQVFTNLVINAAHALEGRTGELRVSTGVLPDGRVRVSFADDGPGIDDRVRATLFEPFVTTKAVGKGSGLGLYVCQQILEALGGVIEDEPQLRGIIEDALDGHAVTLARDGEDARARLGFETFDVILCDVMMPRLSGIALYRWALRERPDLAARFVFVTGGAVDAASRELLDACGRPMVRKPFTGRDVRRAVEG